MTDESTELPWITATDVANYVVCPEAWRLKFVGTTQRRANPRAAESQEIRREWVEKQELSKRLASYAKVAYVLLVLLTILVFVIERNRPEFLNQIVNRMRTTDGARESDRELREATRDQQKEVQRERTNTAAKDSANKDAFTVPEEILSLLLVLGLIIYMWDLFERRSVKTKQASGLEAKSEAVEVRGSTELPAREYHSDALRLTSKPDALIREDQIIIPVDIHPLANKVRDRHVVQLLAHLRLLEEAQEKRPEYGVLLMGREQRRVQIKNTPDKQRWLETLIDEMHSIMEGVPAVPTPSKFKCKSCDVRAACAYSEYIEPKRTEP